MKRVYAVIGILLAVGTIAGATGTAAAAEAGTIHRYWRLAPQDCFLLPDVSVAVNALGPYCSSPRGGRRYATYGSWGWRAVGPPYYVPYYGYYRPWGWSEVNSWSYW
jgi:hypothetical protein